MGSSAAKRAIAAEAPSKGLSPIVLVSTSRAASSCAGKGSNATAQNYPGPCIGAGSSAGDRKIDAKVPA